ncbi:MAG: multifunctional oxoglutarate decarboxylase/oxoglutarate dehydrogenase thiamine pyrophosphate-binding subunit/dihydrolipoyllysine-residue succinyltransferase subunit [Rothia sp. (in: high G+C Gram-positive bacteria)]|uniref:multifunctional oxoglutarate decarboxylase/oxoglutarate dehydrogenase thiamine pyrophosphate-binding subunit/dihydrolipoyllysine-residue succinyltransferase subunit n=1 Tax=Rothia sp. (in: high G+C Gram-positive bacteria) TaxID=1885016 RepID=UPI0026E03493|nr:multifunctional oxoglutarate decarboxylase/oxoglutarate dehydrogenase thiamine pyrophosphate-binding subunit/dihydrolipoyllysine-residue succinyltransferase subunit [Rothia sp. (in: high G+C Gram-positive bacteria)]MDO5750152.1 multifunctional oxoglutarate decarboxylase/oxoglutarate dehydrogenase thiamine pyrophosphate-binding subunit/dihydrolipoyllysine-residue succinyltransferase subunit [Rothia sp. (in: high G+C Gram-positive bacteria)]
MPQLPDHLVPEEFAGNEWFVEEQYDKYRQDPSSVDPSWLPIFESIDKALAADSAAAPAPAAPAASAPTAVAAPAQAPAPAAASAAVAAPKPEPVPTASAPKSKVEPVEEAVDKIVPLRGPAKAIASNMEESLTVPTATTVRAVPAKLLIENRAAINSYLARTRGGKVSFTHLIGYAVIRALGEMPSMNVTYGLDEKGKPVAIHNAHVNFGLAIDLPRPDGSRSLVVPNIKAAETLSFIQFWDAYNDIVKRGRDGKLGMPDFTGTTASLTNPGGIGTVHSVPRLSKGQAVIVGVGALEYPAEFRGVSDKVINDKAISKIITLTSTYDHRVIQGAGSGEFLKLVEHYLLGGDGFYDAIFSDLRIPFEPVRWSRDNQLDTEVEVSKVARIQQLIHAYRVHGHLAAQTSPLASQVLSNPDLQIENYGLTLWDLDRVWPTGGFGGKERLPLRTILELLREAYSGTLAVEYMYIQDPEVRAWFQQKLENGYSKPSHDELLRVLKKLVQAEAFEHFLQTKYLGQKRFSLEGGESLIPLLDAIIGEAANKDLNGVAIGMAHRGRLNVLTNIAGKSYGQIFREFNGTAVPGEVEGSGDVKYHLGTEGVYTGDSGKQTQVYLAANPSHLETVNTVLEGIVRAKQDTLAKQGVTGHPVLPILVHGDAAFAGQGIVMETLQMAGLKAYTTGGTVHIVVNNQIGFTTLPDDGRTATYSSDIARMTKAPVLHVNGDDPEAVVRAGLLAFEYRERFGKDVVIDLVCYRRRGHNEADDPSMTQPTMYQIIDNLPSTRTQYASALVGRGDITQAEADETLNQFHSELDEMFTQVQAEGAAPAAANIAGLELPAAQQNNQVVHSGNTAISVETLQHIANAFGQAPEGFTVHKKLQKLLDQRVEMGTKGNINWGMGELLAFGSLLMEGTNVRMTGQDVQRGTFVQRHAVLHDHETDAEWSPLQHLAPEQGSLEIYNSFLSEYGVLGFEYGYSVERPEDLVIWEAQFGDFANGAQTVIDEYISSSEQKWGQNSSLVMLLPHGYEGQGPDHSSARMERYLQLCAENNMTVAVPSTPANHFHLLRRHSQQRPFKPLVVISPKQLLRLKAAASSVEDFTQGGFQKVIGDRSGVNPANVQRVVFVSGRLYYDLEAERAKRGDSTTAIVSVEQLYPLPEAEIKEQLALYSNARDIVWAQDEPANQGQWPFMAVNLLPLLDRPVRLASRPAAASPAAGTGKLHAAQAAELIAKVFEG